MKKLIALLLACMMVLTLAACGEKPAETTAPAAGGESTPVESNPEAEVTTYKVGVAIYQFDDNFMTLYREELETYMKSLETDTVKYDITIVDGKNDMATQTNQIDTFITQGMDIIICNLVQTSSADVIIDKVVNANIPLVLINREPEGPTDESYPGIIDNAKVCYSGAKASQSGTYQGEILMAQPNQGDINGDGVIKYVMIVGDPENSDAKYRTEYSVKALTDAGLTVECLVENVGNWATDKGQEIAANALSQHGTEIDVIFCNNDGMAIGAAAAIEAAGRVVGQDIYLLGVDALPECVEMVAEGTMTGTVYNDHVAQSHAAVDAAVEALAGGEMQNYYWANYVKVDQDAAINGFK